MLRATSAWPCPGPPPAAPRRQGPVTSPRWRCKSFLHPDGSRRSLCRSWEAEGSTAGSPRSAPRACHPAPTSLPLPASPSPRVGLWLPWSPTCYSLQWQRKESRMDLARGKGLRRGIICPPDPCSSLQPKRRRSAPAQDSLSLTDLLISIIIINFNIINNIY